MSKVQISASVDQKISKIISEQAKKEKRSFSQMVEILLQQACTINKSKKQST